MPGREGSGSLGGSTGSSGGGWGGGSNLGNIGGGLLRGGGSIGGGLLPGGIGIPSLFGPRFGGGGFGCGGCGCILLILVVVVCIVLGVLFGGLGKLFGGFNNAAGSNIISGNNPPAASGNFGFNGSNTGLANQPPSVQTQTALDLNELHGALDSRIPGWQNSIGNNQEQHVSAANAGMGNDNNIKDVVYGKCGSDFYVFVVDKGVPNNANGANGSGYAYTSASSPATCHPSQYSVTDWENDGSGWFFVYLKS